MNWQPIETAPKDGTRIVVWCDDSADPYEAPEGRLTTYAAHCEAFGCMKVNGLAVAQFGGEWDDEDGYIPPWWFVDEDFEQPVNPIYWMPLPPPPSEVRANG